MRREHLAGLDMVAVMEITRGMGSSRIGSLITEIIAMETIRTETTLSSPSLAPSPPTLLRILRSGRLLSAVATHGIRNRTTPTPPPAAWPAGDDPPRDDEPPRGWFPWQAAPRLAPYLEASASWMMGHSPMRTIRTVNPKAPRSRIWEMNW